MPSSLICKKKQDGSRIRVCEIPLSLVLRKSYWLITNFDACKFLWNSTRVLGGTVPTFNVLTNREVNWLQSVCAGATGGIVPRACRWFSSPAAVGPKRRRSSVPRALPAVNKKKIRRVWPERIWYLETVFPDPANQNYETDPDPTLK